MHTPTGEVASQEQIKAELASYYQDVFNLTFDLSNFTFPFREGMPSHMVVHKAMPLDHIVECYKSRFGANFYADGTLPISGSLNWAKEPSRPAKASYAFAYVGGNKPDKCHLGKSYADAAKQGIKFMNLQEYLLVSIFHYWKHGKLVDTGDEAWTILSSFWNDGYAMCGAGYLNDMAICVSNRHHENRLRVEGPREIFLG
jgi:hypothetical protein